MKSIYFKRFALCLYVIVGTALGAIAQNVAKIGTTEYATLAEAVAAASEGQTVTLVSDVVDFGTISFSGKSITLDLNGQTATGTRINVEQNAILEIKDKTATVAPVIDEKHNVTYVAGSLNVSNAVNAFSGGSVTLNSGKIISEYIGLFAKGDVTGATEIKSTVTLEGGYVEAQEFAISPQGKGATANITGGVALARDNAVVGGNGTNNQETKLGGTFINITGGTLIGNIQSAGYVACGVYHPQSGELNVSGGTIYADGGAGIVIRGGTLNVTGGTIAASGDESLLGKVGDSRVVVGTSGIVFDRDAKYYDAPNVNIEISRTPSISGVASAITVINTENIEDANDAIAIKGGTFSSDISEYLDDNVTTTTDENGQTVVKSYVAQVGENKYLTLSEAATNANGTEIKLIYDVVEDVAIPENANVIIDLNGFAVTNKTSDTFTVPISSSLTINDSSEGKTGVVDNVTHAKACIYNNGTVTLNGGMFTRSKEASTSMEDANGNSYYNILNHGDMTINEGVTVYSTGAFSSLIASGYYDYSSTNPRNGYVAGTNKEAPMLVINGGTFSGGINTVKNDDNATAEIKGGTFENVTQHCVMNNNKLIISGGTFDNTGDNAYVVYNATHKTEINVCEMTISGGTYEGGVYCGTKTTITDGTFNGNIKVIEGNEPEISGGTFITDVTEYCVEGFIPVKGEDGTYTVATGDVFITKVENEVESSSFVSLSGDNKVLDLDHSTISKLMVNADFENVTINYKRDFSNNWSDLFVPFEITLTSDLLAKFSFAELWDTELVDNEPTIECIVMKEGDVIKANTPYIIKANTEGEQTIVLTDASLKKTIGVSGELAADCSSIKQTFKFYGVYENTTLLDKYGYFLNSSEQSSFYTVSDATASLSPMRFYMTVQNKADDSYYYPNGTNANAKKSVKLHVIGGGEETTGITDVNVAKAQDEQSVYTLQGIFAGKSTDGLKAGIYIVNGKKIIIK